MRNIMPSNPTSRYRTQYTAKDTIDNPADFFAQFPTLTRWEVNAVLAARVMGYRHFMLHSKHQWSAQKQIPHPTIEGETAWDSIFVHDYCINIFAALELAREVMMRAEFEPIRQAFMGWVRDAADARMLAHCDVLVPILHSPTMRASLYWAFISPSDIVTGLLFMLDGGKYQCFASCVPEYDPCSPPQ